MRSHVTTNHERDARQTADGLWDGWAAWCVSIGVREIYH